MKESILKGMVQILWGGAWASHVEEKNCRSLSGLEITEHMPRVPSVALAHAARIASEIEAANGCTLEALFEHAMAADRAYLDAETAERFGNCLAFMANGDGVSWFDDHEAFPLNVPYDEEASIQLRDHAEETCVLCRDARIRGDEGQATP